MFARATEPTLLLSAGVAALAAVTCTTGQKPAGGSATPQASSSAAVQHPRWHSKHKGGVDLSTGIYVRTDDDLVVDTPLPIVLERTYNSGDSVSRQFGIATTHPGELWIHGDGDPTIPWGELILAEGGRLRFTRISPGTSQVGAVLRHQGSPSEYDGALLSWNGSLWDMKLRNGSMESYLDCQQDPEVCSIVERRDADGHRIAFVRDPAGTLLRMESEGRSISFEYDTQRRITRASDSSGRSMAYTYDDGGRLTSATSSWGVVWRYYYDVHGKLIRIREPRRIIDNRFDDESGRWIGQVVKFSEDDDDPYIASARYVVDNGSIVESSYEDPDGVVVDRYNTRHYVVSKILNATSAAPITFKYERDASNWIRATTLSCTGIFGRPITQTVSLTSDTDDAAAAEARGHCLVDP